jgi:hypothetical protein
MSMAFSFYALDWAMEGVSTVNSASMRTTEAARKKRGSAGGQPTIFYIFN